HGGYHYLNQYTSALNSAASAFWHVWSNFYIAINTCNTVVARAEEVEISDEIKNVMVGEARFLRAHYYFELVRLFGPVHLTLEETQSVETEARRDSEEAIYAAIIEDLNF